MKTLIQNCMQWLRIAVGTQGTKSMRNGQGTAIPIVSFKYPYSKGGASVAYPLLKYAAALLLLFTLGIGQMRAADAPVNTVLWGENFGHFTAGEKPSEAKTGSGTTIYGGATITYAQSSTNTKAYAEKLAGGTSPELLLAKSSTTWTISGIKTGGATGMGLTFLSNKTTFTVTVSSSNLEVTGSGKSWTISLKTGKTDPGTFNLTIKNTGSSNARIDNVELKVTTAAAATLYTVTYDANGGSVTPASVTQASAGASVTLATPTRTGYTCNGWYTATSGGTKRGNAGASYTPTASETVHAQWTAKEYTLTLDKGTGGSADGSAKVKYDAIAVTNLSHATHATMVLQGYYTDASGGTKVLNADGTFAGASVTGYITSSKWSGTSNTILYAQWAAASKTLSSIAITTAPTTTKYLVGDTFNKTGAVVTATYSDASTTAVTASATWTPTTGLTSGSNTITATYTEGGVTKTATTTVTAYSVTVQKKDETGATISADGVSASCSGRTLSASANAASKYVFKTWKFGTASGTSIASATSASTSLTGTPSANVTVIAEFYKPVTVTFVDGAGSTHSTTTVARGGVPTKPGSNPSSCDATSTTFIGWTQTAWSGKVAQSVIDGKTAANVKVYKSADALPAATADITYYAVFAKESGGGSTTYTFGWESADNATPWTLTNLDAKATYSSYKSAGSYAASTGGKETADIKYSTKISPTAISCKYTKATSNTNSSSKFVIQTSSDGSSWTTQATGKTMNNVTQGTFETLSWSGSLSNVYVRIAYTGTTAVRVIDEVSITAGGGTSYSDYLTTCVACSADPNLSSAPALKGAISNTSVGVTISSASVRDNCEWTDYGFVWSASSTPTIGGSGATKVQVGTSGNASTWDGTLTGSFTVGTTYYYRGYGKNSKAGANFVYSSQSSFTLRSITFESNGGTAVPTMYVNSGTTATAPSEPTRDGYTFGGWYSNSGLTTAVNWSSSITANKTYYAKWIATPTLTVNKASIAFGTKAIGDSYTETFTVSGANLTNNISIAVSGTNAGMFAVSTASISKGSGTVAATTITVTYTPTTAASHSATITVSSTGATSKTITLTGTGRYEDKFIDVVHNTTGYTEVSPHIETGSYSTPALSDKAAASTGTCDEVHYHFVGWITKAKHDAGTAIAAGDIKTPTTANGTTYYAVWAKEGTGGGGAAVNTVLYSENFGGYSADGVPSGKVNTSTGNRFVYGGGSVTYSVTNGGGTTKVYAASLAGGTSPELLVAKSSGTFVIAGIPKGGASELTLSYKQNGKSLTTSVSGTDYSGGKSSSTAGTTTTTITCGSASTFTLTFTAGSENVRLDDIEIKVKTAGITYTDYVSSCGETYNITLNKNGGTTNGAATVTENATQLNSGFTAPVWAGHQVEGYYTTSACATKIATAEGVLQNNITVSGTPWTDASGKWVKGGDATFYAKWEAKQCVITLNNVSATTAGTPSVTATYGANTNLTTSITKPEKTGYVFGGYYTEPSGAGTQLIDANGAWLASKTGYTNASKQWQLDAATLTVYAYWTIQTYTVNWYVNGISVAHEDNVPYNRQYSYLNNEPDVANNALASCNSNKFIGWVTADGQYTADGGTKSAQYDPYTVTGSTTITADRKDFYAMFATETGSSFDLSVTSGDFKIFGLVSDVRYYVTGALDNGAYDVTTDADDADEFTFTKVSDGVYTIKHKRSNKFVKWSGSTNFKEETTSEEWTITTASHGSWCMTPESATTRAFIMYYSSSNPENNNIFKPYSKSNATNTPAQYYYVEIGGGTLTDYRTGCCDEKITLNVTGATNGTYTLKFNNAAQTSGTNVSTCAASTVEFKVTANAGYTLTNMSISGTNKTLTITPSPITTGLPSTNEMTYTVSVPALATGTLTITPTFTQTYSVTYNLDGGETAGSTATTRYQSGESVTLVTPNPTKTGYDFTGWTVTKAGGGTVTVSAGAFTMPSDNVTVTAGWTAKPLTSISVTPTTAEVYVGQYVVLPVTYDPADVLTKGYTLVATPGYCVTTGSTNTTLKLTGGRGGVSITEDKVETVSIKANADNTKTASVTITVKPLPVDHFLDLIHGQTFADQVATIVDNALSASYTAPGHDDVDAPVSGNDCEKGHLHLIGWIESEWADAHLTATMAEIKAAKDDGLNPLFHNVYSPMTASNKTYYAVWAHEVE